MFGNTVIWYTVVVCVCCGVSKFVSLYLCMCACVVVCACVAEVCVFVFVCVRTYPFEQMHFWAIVFISLQSWFEHMLPLPSPSPSLSLHHSPPHQSPPHPSHPIPSPLLMIKPGTKNRAIDPKALQAAFARYGYCLFFGTFSFLWSRKHLSLFPKISVLFCYLFSAQKKPEPTQYHSDCK